MNRYQDLQVDRRWRHAGAARGALVAALVVSLAACGKSGGTTATPQAARSTTTAATTTTVAAPLNSDDLADRLIGVNDIGSDWQQEGEQYIGEDDVKAAEDKSVRETYTCDGKPVAFRSSDTTYHGEAAVFFTQDEDYPLLSEDLVTAKPSEISADIAAFDKVFGNCDQMKVTDTYEDGTSESVSGTSTQFAIPNTGADEQYAYLITFDVQGQAVNTALVYMRKGSTGVRLEYDSINQFDAVAMSDLAAAAIRKLDSGGTSS